MSTLHLSHHSPKRLPEQATIPAGADLQLRVLGRLRSRPAGRLLLRIQILTASFKKRTATFNKATAGFEKRTAVSIKRTDNYN